MAEKKSLLDQIRAKDTIGKSPFAKDEKTRPLRIKESKYDLINRIAFEQHKTKVEVIDEILEAGIKKLHLLEKYPMD